MVAFDETQLGRQRRSPGSGGWSGTPSDLHSRGLYVVQRRRPVLFHGAERRFVASGFKPYVISRVQSDADEGLERSFTARTGPGGFALSVSGDREPTGGGLQW